VSEAELQRLVEELCARLHLAHYHTFDSRRSEPGFPDSVIVGTEILYRELKSKDGVLTPHQRRWGSRIERAGGNWAVWRPADWGSMTILNQLLAIAAPRTHRETPAVTAGSPWHRQRAV
jgi:hypothetical protein